MGDGGTPKVGVCPIFLSAAATTVSTTWVPFISLKAVSTDPVSNAASQGDFTNISLGCVNRSF